MWTLLKNLPNQTIKDKTMNIVYWEIKDDKVYHQGRLHKNADVDSFEVFINPTVQYDKYGTILSPFFSRDKTHIYWAWRKTKLDRETFEILGYGYIKDKNAIYFKYESSIKPVKNHDFKSFVVLDNGYAYDDYQAYYYARVLKKCQNPKSLKPLGFCFAKDNQFVYWQGKEFKNIDINTVQIMPCSKFNFIKDDKYIYYISNKITRSDNPNWEHLHGYYSKDENFVYHMDKILPNENPNDWDKQKAKSSPY